MKQLRLLRIIRGLPGSGKTTRVKEQLLGHNTCSSSYNSADNYFTSTGVYVFAAAKLSEAHASCQVGAIKAMAAGTEVVIVDNTHTRRAEFAVVAEIGKLLEYDILIEDLYDGGLSDEELFQRCRHGVPLWKITQMRERYE